MIKVLVVVYNKEKRLRLLLQKYNLNYKIMTSGEEMRNSKFLECLGLNGIKKNLYYVLINSEMEDYIFNDLKIWCNIEKMGQGIAFTMSLTSSNKFIKDDLDKDCKDMKKDNYELIVTVVSMGYGDYVMQAAHSCGCSGGTLIKARSLGSHGTIFMDISIEPEKEIILNIVSSDIKKKVMEKITKECGMKTEARGVVMSLPIDRVIGLNE